MELCLGKIWFGGTIRLKFAEEDGAGPHDYGDLFFTGDTKAGPRLVIGPSSNQIGLMRDLATEFSHGPWFVLYVLLVPAQEKRERGRYQSELFDSADDLRLFLADFARFFEGDGRHHVWVGSTAGDVRLVYDQHNVIFAYGPVERYREILVARGFEEREFWFPAPHTHFYNRELDSEEERLMSSHEWKQFPLQPADEW